MTQNILTFAQEHIVQGKQVALVTVTETDGSSPASAGQMMAVLMDGSSVGTVGGGMTENLVKNKAMEAIKDGKKVFSFSLDHAESGMLCGGTMSGYGNVLGEENHLYIFGGGYISQFLAPLAASTGFFVTVLEDRPEFESEFKGGLVNITYMVCKSENYKNEIQLLGSPYVVICTRGHKTDDDAMRFCLSEPSKSIKYLGMIGSLSKVNNLFERLYQEGYSKKTLENIYTPIGLDIASSVPAEIAVSIMAEILLVKNNGSLSHKRKAN